jgi:hypothetical protein
MVIGDHLCILRSGAAMLQRVLQRNQGLRPLAVVLAIPGLPLAVRGTDQTHRVEGDHPDPDAKRASVGKEMVGHVAGGTGDCAVRAENGCRKKLSAERSSLRPIGDAVGGVWGQWGQRSQRQRTQQSYFFVCPAGRVAGWTAGDQQPHAESTIRN